MAKVLCPACGLYVPLYPSHTADKGTMTIHGRVPVGGDIWRPDNVTVCPGAGRTVWSVYARGIDRDFKIGEAGEILLP